MNEWGRQRSGRRLARRVGDSGWWFECWRVHTPRPDGYAVFGDGTYHQGERFVHRIVYLATHGRIPEGWEVAHLCFVHNCFNPFHLAAVPARLNRRKPAWAYVTRCPKNHPLSGENLYVNPSTHKRACRECMRVANRKAYTRRREALQRVKSDGLN